MYYNPSPTVLAQVNNDLHDRYNIPTFFLLCIECFHFCYSIFPYFELGKERSLGSTASGSHMTITWIKHKFPLQTSVKVFLNYNQYLTPPSQGYWVDKHLKKKTKKKNK